eukprot:6190539-Pleurochrysis_carterae.AAC.1
MELRTETRFDLRVLVQVSRLACGSLQPPAVTAVLTSLLDQRLGHADFEETGLEQAPTRVPRLLRSRGRLEPFPVAVWLHSQGPRLHFVLSLSCFCSRYRFLRSPLSSPSRRITTKGKCSSPELASFLHAGASSSAERAPPQERHFAAV